MRFPDETGRSLAEVVREAPSGALIELAPGRYRGPILVERGLTLKGAGDLSRISGGPGSLVRVASDEQVVLESLLLEGGRSELGGGIEVSSGKVRLFNLHIRDCVAAEAGGGIRVGGGAMEAERLRIHNVRAARGGALAVEGSAVRVSISDSEIGWSEAAFGGALAVAGAATVRLEALTVRRARAMTSSGGQVLWVTGRGGAVVELTRVRFEDAPVGRPLVNDKDAPARLWVNGCDLPRWVQATPGLEVVGDTRWR